MDYTFKAVKGEQWGKTTYTASIPFIQLGEICKVDAEVQRRADSKRMEVIADYILDGLTGRRFMAGFNSIVTSLRYSSLNYNEESCEVRISTRGKLYISDGQHRNGGISVCVERVEGELEKAREENDTEALKYWSHILKRLEEMKISVLIFTDLTKEEEQQLFHDLNNLGVVVNQTQALSLDSTDPFNRIAKQLSNEIPGIKKHGINKISKTLSDKNKEVATLGTWNKCMRILLNGSSDAEMKQTWNEEWNYEDRKTICNEFWSSIISVLPDDFVDKEKYLITKAAYLQGIAAFGHKIMFEQNITSWKSIISKLQGYNWSHSNDSYSIYGGGSLSTKNNAKTGRMVSKFYFKGTRAAINSVNQALQEYTK
ncbi:DNA sulfur modification protein DndB [Clostridium estertheticum]|uniref:DNA sulfur modification protein DndB n=1 Tax=Clostridium estertheticum TaxID=238834 RepID=UPI001CF4E082|nr:DNA sulfur modification protein DndB [Clostridium estertheticum]MCB2339096.1 DNA sulfur modification protein DndB [Clostridium estertheticum]